MTVELDQLRHELVTTRLALLLAIRHAHAGRTDPVTSLPTRSTFTAHAGERLRNGRAVLLLDLDEFKPVNDGHGHHAGDEVLAALGARLRAWQGDATLWARLGGDEFAATIDVSAPGWRADLDDLVGAVAEPIGLSSGAAVAVSASIGVAAPGAGSTVSETLRAADAAMYRSKAFGGCQWRLYDPADDGDLLLTAAPRHRARHARPSPQLHEVDSC